MLNQDRLAVSFVLGVIATCLIFAGVLGLLSAFDQEGYRQASQLLKAEGYNDAVLETERRRSFCEGSRQFDNGVALKETYPGYRFETGDGKQGRVCPEGNIVVVD